MTDSSAASAGMISEDLEELRSAVLTTMLEHKAFRLLPDSGKVVVFDADLPVRHAFLALVEHDIKCAPIWSCSRNEFSGMITVTDFIDIVVQFHAERSARKQSFVDAVGDQTCAKWTDKKYRNRMFTTTEVDIEQQETEESNFTLISVSPEQTLYDCIVTLNNNNIHRLPVVRCEPENAVLCIINHQRILRFIMSKLHQTNIDILKHITIGDLEVGTFGDDTIRVNDSTKLIDTLALLKIHRVPAVVIVDENNKFVDVYTRSDVRFLALDSTYDKLEMTMSEALANHHAMRVIPVFELNDTIEKVFYKMLGTRKHACVIVDEDNSVMGMISLSQIFRFFINDQDVQ